MSTAGKFNKLERLGDGTYGVVYKAESRSSREIVALKRMNPAPEEEGVPATTIREIALLKELKHPNVVMLKDLMFESPKLTLIFEYCEWDLKKLMDAKGTLSVSDIQHFLRHLLEGLAYCHFKHIVHRDLKPQNLLIEDPRSETKKLPANDDSLKDRNCRELVLKLADFGLARVEGIPVKKYSHEAVTLWYRSPDVILGSTNYGLPVDMWSVGCIFAEMISGVPLFNAKTDSDQLLRMYKLLGSPTKDSWPSMTTYPNYRAMMLEKPGMEARYPSSFDDYSRTHNLSRIGEDGLKLLLAMLRYEPSQRITAVDALNHPFFKSYDAPRLAPLTSSGSSTTAGQGSSSGLAGSLNGNGSRRASGGGDGRADSGSNHAADAAHHQRHNGEPHDGASKGLPPRRLSSMAYVGDGGDKPDAASASGRMVQTL